MTMPPLLKLAALAVSIAGLVVALELASLTNKQHKITPNLLAHNFSNILGFFPLTVHRSVPYLNLALGQTIASQAMDLTWLEKTLPKAASAPHLQAAKTVTQVQQGVIKTYLGLFFLTLALCISLIFLNSA